MPTYQYRCRDCSAEHEVVQRFTDDPLSLCPECGGSVRKVFSAVGVVFKGSGFYATDNRTKAATKSTTSTSDAVPATASNGSDAAGSDQKPAQRKKPAQGKQPAPAGATPAA